MTPEIAITATAHRCLMALAKAAIIEASGAYRPAGSPGNKEAVLPDWIDGKLALARHDSDQQTGKIIMVTSAEKLMGSPYFLPSGELLVLPNKSGDQTPLILTCFAGRDDTVAALTP